MTEQEHLDHQHEEIVELLKELIKAVEYQGEAIRDCIRAN